MKLSVVIITKNEEKDINDCINSVSFADEIIVIDSNSSDNTTKIAKQKNAKVYIHTFEDFASQRNWAIEKAHGEWILYIDADERVSSELGDEIRQVITTPRGIVAYNIPRKNFYFGKYEWPYIETTTRLFLKEKLKGWIGKVHESPTIDGNKKTLHHYLLHYTHDDLEAMVIKTNQWSKIESTLLLDSQHPLMVPWRFIRIMLTKFYDSFIRQGGWKIGVPGLIESLYQSFSYFIVYAKLWEKQIQSRK